MRTFNPMFNSFNLARSTSPFATAGSSFAVRNASRGLISNLGSSKITLSGILNGAQKTIGTVNQIVPIYNQIKPMVQNSKTLLNVIKGLKLPSTRNNKNIQNTINTVTVESAPELDKADVKEEKNGDTPSKPFFI